MNQSWLENQENLNKYAEGLIHLLGETPGIYFFVWDIEGENCYMTPSIENEFATHAQEIDNPMDAWVSLVYHADRTFCERSIMELQAGREKEISLNLRMINNKNERVWVTVRAQAHKGEQEQVARIIGSISHMDKGNRADNLTGLFNQHQFAEDYNNNLEFAQSGYLVIFGIDDFKTVNERYGREFGNRLLTMFAHMMEEKLGAGGQIYRLDGDRFAVNMPDKNQMAVHKYYSSVNIAFQDLCRTLQEDIYSTISGGAVCYPYDGEEFSQLFQFADSALNTAKRMGKNNLVFFAFEAYEQYVQDIGMREDLQRCVKNGFEGFELYYQPQVSVNSGRVEGAEALLRWSSREHGRITPNVFIPLLEKHGLICQVGRWVIDQALSICKKWRDIIPNFCMSINLSYIQLEKDDISGILLSSLRRYELPGEAVLLELTESNQLQNYHFYNETLSYLNRIGVMVAIDDFGTGYSSLGYFKELNINQIKIDRCFVTRIRDSEYDFKLIEFIIDLAHSIDVSVCVEGVETLEELSALMPLSPDYIQGFYFGRPVSTEFFEENFITNWTDVGEELIRKLDIAIAVAVGEGRMERAQQVADTPIAGD